MLFDYFVLISVVTSVTVLLVYCAITGISPIPSSSISRDHMFSLIEKGETGTIVELGAGWGSVAFPMAGLFPESGIFAIELSPIPWFVMKLRHLVFRYSNLEIVRANFLKYPLPADTRVVVCYLHSEMLEKARPVLERTLKPGTKVISNVFDIPGWEPEAVHRLEDSFCPQVYVYRVPDLRPEMTVLDGGRSDETDLEQRGDVAVRIA